MRSWCEKIVLSRYAVCKGKCLVLLNCNLPPPTALKQYVAATHSNNTRMFIIQNKLQLFIYYN